MHKRTEPPKQMTQMLAELKGERNSYIIVVGDFNKPPLVRDRISREKIKRKNLGAAGWFRWLSI